MPSVEVERPKVIGIHRWRVGLVERYLFRSVMSPLLLLAAGLLLFLELERALRLLEELYATGSDLSYFLPLLLSMAPFFVNLALPPAFFIATAVTVARLDDHGEVHAILSSGLSLLRIALPLMAAGAVVGALAIATSGWLEPIGRHAARTLRAKALAEGQIETVRPGALYRPAPGLLLLVETRRDGTRSVFAWHRGAAGTSQAVSSNGVRLALGDQARTLTAHFPAGRLLADHRYRGEIRQRVMSFTDLTISVPLPPFEREWRRGRDERELTLPELVNPDDFPHLRAEAVRAELWSRLLKAAMLPLVPLFILPLAIAGGRGGRLPAVIFAAVVLITCQYELNVLRQTGASGDTDAVTAMAASVLALVIAAALLFASGRMLPSHSPMSRLLDALSRLVRFPGHQRHVVWSVKGARLASYIAGRILAWTAASLLILVILLISAEIFLQGDAFARRGMGAADVLTYIWLRAPALALQALPAAALVGPIVAFALMVSRWEMVGFRLAGYSVGRVFLISLPAALAVAAGSWLIAERVAPESQRAFLTWWGDERLPQGGWLRSGPTLVHAVGSIADGATMTGVTIFHRTPDGTLTGRTEAAQMHHGPNGWLMGGVRRTMVIGDRASIEQVPVQLWRGGPAPHDVRGLFTGNHMISAARARAVLASRTFAIENMATYRTRRAREPVQFLIPMLMLLISLPVAGASHLRSSAGRRVGWAVGTGALFLVCDGWAVVAASSGILPPVTGAWLAPAIFFPIAWAALVLGEA